jgi:chromosome partitioning protein
MGETAKVVAVINQKGGVGKTTIAHNLSAAFVARGQRVLVIDLDSQGHLTRGLGLWHLFEREGAPSLYHSLADRKKQFPLKDVVQEHPIEKFSVIPSNFEMALADRDLNQQRDREHKLRHIMEPLLSAYDWIILDTPPYLTPTSDNAINASRRLLIPVEADGKSLGGLELQLNQIEGIEIELNIYIGILAIVPNRVEDNRESADMLTLLRSNFPHVAPFDLRKRTLLAQAWTARRSIYTFEPRGSSQERVRNELVAIYDALADLVTARYAEEDARGR